eukprot:6526036-Pyramimonas_sp.AAC.1
MFSIFEGCKTGRTMNIVWSIIMWSFQCLYRGCFPTRDHRNVEFPEGSSEAYLGSRHARLAGDFFCVIWSIKGDLDWFAKALKLNNYNADRPCEHDDCHRHGAEGMHPMNFGASCTWKKH